MLAAVLLVVLLPVWLPLAALADLVRGRLRLPTVRLLAFGSVLGVAGGRAGVHCAFGLWFIGRRDDQPLHFRAPALVGRAADGSAEAHHRHHHRRCRRHRAWRPDRRSCCAVTPAWPTRC